MSERLEKQRDAALAKGCAHDRAFSFSKDAESLNAPAMGTLLRFERPNAVLADALRALSFGADRVPHALVAGALAFDRDMLPMLRLYRQWEASAPVVRPTEMMVIQPPRAIAAQPTAAGYERAVAQAVALIRNGELDKLVLARALDLTLAGPLEFGAVLGRLRAQNPSAYVFACDVSRSDAERRLLVGASPELLVEKRGETVRSHPLAGSLPRAVDAGEDQARADRLMQSAKNLHEHALVVEAVADTLSPYCRTLHVPARPAVVQTNAMWHLGTEISGRLRDPETSSLELALALHPTPAVCGVPRARAAEAITALEGFDRAYFAGAVGYCDARGDGAWAVAIRCAELTERTLRLYAGAGIVGDSVPADELAETTAKLRTMSRALGFEQILEEC